MVLVACWWLLPLGARLHPTTPTVGGTWDPPSLTPVQGLSRSLPHHTSSRSILGHCVPCPFPSHSNATCLTNPPFIPIPTTTTAFPALHSDNRLSFSLQQHQHKHKQTNTKSFAFLIFLIVASQPPHLSSTRSSPTHLARALTSIVKKLPAILLRLAASSIPVAIAPHANHRFALRPLHQKTTRVAAITFRIFII
ncbi:hypothetical protein DER46DRAFT_51584 [Fusarium sp. MPI-SDFR-AT-0072]|nr:hypothetical protein DER46DRAFT_51584 [Fusarium sp. MPI-SDFR-AT-0072]